MKLLLCLLITALPVLALALPEPAPVDEYPIHPDGGLVYDPLRRDAEKTGQLAKYRKAAVTKHQLNLGTYSLEFETPKKATAYDVVPIRYRLAWNDTMAVSPAGFPVAVEATAFEEEKRRKGRNLFDLALPGRIDLKVDYLGSITAHHVPGAKHNLEPDLSESRSSTPPSSAGRSVRTGNYRRATPWCSSFG